MTRLLWRSSLVVYQQGFCHSRVPCCRRPLLPQCRWARQSALWGFAAVSNDKQHIQSSSECSRTVATPRSSRGFPSGTWHGLSTFKQLTVVRDWFCRGHRRDCGRVEVAQSKLLVKAHQSTYLRALCSLSESPSSQTARPSDANSGSDVEIR